MKLYKDVVNLILDFIPKYRLRDWVAKKKKKLYSLSRNPAALSFFNNDPKKIGHGVHWIYLSRNPSAIPILEKNLDKVDWGMLSANPAAISILEKNLDKVNWDSLCRNPSAVSLLEKNLEDGGNNICWNNLSGNPSPKIMSILEKYMDNKDCYIEDWYGLSSNPAAMSIIEKDLEKGGYNIRWSWLSSNPSSKAISILEKNLDKVNWHELSRNPSAIPILEKNLDKVDWYYLSENPSAIHILEKNLDKVDWNQLSSNPSPGAISLLEKNLEEVNWYRLSSNPGIFVLCRDPVLFNILMEIEIK